MNNDIIIPAWKIEAALSRRMKKPTEEIPVGFTASSVCK
jgi:hypothetical protein